MAQVLVLNGVARSGKDTFADEVIKSYPGSHAELHSTVARVKEVAKYFGADETLCKGEAERRLWSDLKDAWTRYNDGPFQEILQKMETLNTKYPAGDALLICMIREPPEIEKLHKTLLYGCLTTVLIRRFTGEPVPKNHADLNVENYNYDFRFHNNHDVAALQGLARSIARYIHVKAAKITKARRARWARYA